MEPSLSVLSVLDAGDVAVTAKIKSEQPFFFLKYSKIFEL